MWSFNEARTTKKLSQATLKLTNSLSIAAERKSASVFLPPQQAIVGAIGRASVQIIKSGNEEFSEIPKKIQKKNELNLMNILIFNLI